VVHLYTETKIHRELLVTRQEQVLAQLQQQEEKDHGVEALQEGPTQLRKRQQQDINAQLEIPKSSLLRPPGRKLNKKITQPASTTS